MLAAPLRLGLRGVQRVIPLPEHAEQHGVLGLERRQALRTGRVAPPREALLHAGDLRRHARLVLCRQLAAHRHPRCRGRRRLRAASAPAAAAAAPATAADAAAAPARGFGDDDRIRACW